MNIHIVAWNMDIGALSASVIRPLIKTGHRTMCSFPARKDTWKKVSTAKRFWNRKKAFCRRVARRDLRCATKYFLFSFWGAVVRWVFGEEGGWDWCRGKRGRDVMSVNRCFRLTRCDWFVFMAIEIWEDIGIGISIDFDYSSQGRYPNLRFSVTFLCNFFDVVEWCH